MPASFKICLLLIIGIIAALVATRADGQSARPTEKVVVSYPSKSITNFPSLETARQQGFFQREGLHVSLVYIRGGLDIQTLLTNDADFAMGSTTAVTAFVAGAPGEQGVLLVEPYKSEILPTGDSKRPHEARNSARRIYKMFLEKRLRGNGHGWQISPDGLHEVTKIRQS